MSRKIDLIDLDTGHVLKDVPVVDEVTLAEKWRREYQEERARLRRLSRDELLNELEAVGVGQEMIDEIMDRLI